MEEVDTVTTRKYFTHIAMMLKRPTIGPDVSNDKDSIGEEPSMRKRLRSVLKTSQGSDSLTEFNKSPARWHSGDR